MKLLFKKLLSVALLGLLFSSCKKQLLDINVDPNNPTTASATPDLVLSAALNNTVGIYANPTADSRFQFAAIWLGHIGYSGNYAISTENLSYALTTNFAAAAFGNLYDNIEDYDFVQTKGVAAGNKFYQAVGMLMKAYNFQTLVDLYNNVPYSEALKGTGSSYPKYDDAKGIYDDLNKQIDAAIALFKISVSGGISGDIMFGGNPVKWLKFANTVKLRLLLRQSQRADRAAYITTEMAKLVGASFLDFNATVNPGYLNSAGKTNPFWGANVNTSGTYTQDVIRAGQYSIAFSKSHGDTIRMKRFYTGVGKDNIDSMKKYYPNALYQGNYFGDQGLTNSKTSGFGFGVLNSFSQPAVIMTAAESYFLQAEAVVRGYLGGSAQTLYQNGVIASHVFLNAGNTRRNVANTADSTLSPTDVATTYYSQPGDNQVNWAAAITTADKIALIIRQKWAALGLINELELFNDYRRLKLPADVPLSTSPYSTGIFPQRLLYPQREYDVNAANVLAQGTITPSSKVWWLP